MIETKSNMEARPNSHLFALVIGIGKYALKQFSKLPGAVPDANEVVNWLFDDLNVPRNQVSLITDEAASRAGIISALEAFRSDDRIRQGDPILIYYAGHGSSIPPPEDWECCGISVGRWRRVTWRLCFAGSQWVGNRRGIRTRG